MRETGVSLPLGDEIKVDVVGLVMLIIICHMHVITLIYVRVYIYILVCLGPAKTLENLWIP